MNSLGLLFQSIFNITKCHILNKTADVTRPCQLVFLHMQMQHRALAVDKIKIEPAMISFMENTSRSLTMVDQNDDFIMKERWSSLSVFFKFQMEFFFLVESD